MLIIWKFIRGALKDLISLVIFFIFIIFKLINCEIVIVFPNFIIGDFGFLNKRVSPVAVKSRISNTIYMTISRKRLFEYRKYSYFRERDIISRMFINDSLEAIDYCKKYKGKTIKTDTNETILEQLKNKFSLDASQFSMKYKLKYYGIQPNEKLFLMTNADIREFWNKIELWKRLFRIEKIYSVKIKIL